jgi:hypothetical protein
MTTAMNTIAELVQTRNKVASSLKRIGRYSSGSERGRHPDNLRQKNEPELMLEWRLKVSTLADDARAQSGTTSTIPPLTTRTLGYAAPKAKKTSTV